MTNPILRSPWLLSGSFFLAAVVGGLVSYGAQHLAGGERAEGGEAIRTYLLEHPEVLPEAMEKLQEREYAKAIAPNRKAFETPFAGAEWGNPKGDVTVVAFLDYACGYCRASLPSLAKLVASDPNVRIVYREYPVLGDASVSAARWALAAAEQGKFRAFHEALYANGQLDEASIASAATGVGLDKARAARVMATPAIDGEISNNHKLAASIGGRGTPVWVIGDKVIPGYVEYSVLADAVKKAREKKA
ncbi:disulfide bond formation protein DsbA [Nostoc sp. 3335mG]|jgi:protein-disulfide isomerase|nr:disulfide bond formation protein DsbA [Nostoc sp. 3335mG]